jgi:hypothetical protein
MLRLGIASYSFLKNMLRSDGENLAPITQLVNRKLKNIENPLTNGYNIFRYIFRNFPREKMRC